MEGGRRYKPPVAFYSAEMSKGIRGSTRGLEKGLVVWE